MRKFVAVIFFSVVACSKVDPVAQFSSETPPCHLPPLSENEVRDAVIKAGKYFAPEDRPEPIWQVSEVRCVYRYEQSARYVDGKPVPLSTPGGTYIVWVARDRTTLRWVL